MRLRPEGPKTSTVQSRTCMDRLCGPWGSMCRDEVEARSADTEDLYILIHGPQSVQSWSNCTGLR